MVEVWRLQIAAEWGCMFLLALAFLAVVTHGCITVNVRIQYALVVVLNVSYCYAAVAYLDGISDE